MERPEIITYVCTGHGPSYVIKRRYLHPKHSWTPDAAIGRRTYPGRDGSGRSSVPSSPLLSMAMTCPMVGRLDRSDCTQRSATCTHRSACRGACSCPSTPKSASMTSLALFSIQCCHTCAHMPTVYDLSLQTSSEFNSIQGRDAKGLIRRSFFFCITHVFDEAFRVLAFESVDLVAGDDLQH
jgi:hypothetical protein